MCLGRLLFLLVITISACSSGDFESNSTLLSQAQSDLNAANEKFSHRDESKDLLLESRQMFKLILDNSYGSDSFYDAVAMYLRTFVYEGNHYYPSSTKSDSAGKKRVFNECRMAAEQYASPKILGFESPVYFYFKSLCILSVVDISTVTEQLQFLPILNASIDKGLNTQGGRDYEGGGLYRLKAALKMNEAYRGVPGGTYNPDESLKLIDSALSSEAYPGNAVGSLFCESYKIKSELLKKTSSSRTNSLFLAQSLYLFKAYIGDDLIPEFIRAETIDCIPILEKAFNASGYFVKTISWGAKIDHGYYHEVTTTFSSNDEKSGKVSVSLYCESKKVYETPSDVLNFEAIPYSRELANTTLTIVNKVNSLDFSCPSPVYFAVLDTNNIAVKNLQVDPYIDDLGLTNPAFIKTTRNDIAKYRSKTIYYQGQMSKVLGDRKSLHCMIKDYENDANSDIETIIFELKGQYKKIFGVDYRSSDIDCTIPPKSTNEINECLTKPDTRPAFCTFYELYSQNFSWFKNAVSEANDRKLKLAEGQEFLRSELDKIVKELENVMNAIALKV